MKSIAIIPAREGSKRIKNKNIKKFHGKPIISYSIETAKKSDCFENIYVSTDSPEIADIAEDYGASVPFLREKRIADDKTDTLTVIKDAIKKLEKIDDFENVCCLYATAPLLTADFLIKGDALCKKESDSFIVSVSEYSHPVQRSFKVSETSRLIIETKDSISQRTQDLDKYFHDAGQFYFGHKLTFLNSDCLLNENSSAVILPKRMSCDIDTHDDWELAEALYQLQNS